MHQVFAAQYLGQLFPWSTLLVNVVGCLAMGLVAGFASHLPAISPELRLFLATGFLGGFTTFSAFALDTAILAERGLAISGVYVAVSVVVSIAALYFGLALAKLVA